MQLKAKANVLHNVIDKLAEYDTITLAQAEKVRLMKRTDIKYVGRMSAVPKLLSALVDEYKVQIVSDDRYQSYQTIYLDTNDLSMYNEHRNKFSYRQKIRIRTYTLAGETYFEVKTNTKGCTDKKRIRIFPNQDWKNDAITFLAEVSDYKIDELQPMLVSKFDRITLVNRALSARLTIDFNISFHNIKCKTDINLSDFVIVELKCDKEECNEMTTLLKTVKLKQIGFSKYCVGMALTDLFAEHSEFKKQIEMVESVVKM